MTLYRQLSDRPSKDDLEQGHALIEKAKRIGGKTDRERLLSRCGRGILCKRRKGDLRNEDRRLLASSRTIA